MKKLYVDKSKIAGTGLFTEDSVKKHEHIAFIDGPIVVFKKFTPKISKKMINWIGVGKYSWINTDQSIFKFINHCCEPNAAQITKRKVVATKNIVANSEITIDYSLTEAEPGWSINPCKCGAKKCRGKVLPINKLPRSTFNNRKKYIPEVFKKIYSDMTK